MKISINLWKQSAGLYLDRITMINSSDQRHLFSNQQE